MNRLSASRRAFPVIGISVVGIVGASVLASLIGASRTDTSELIALSGGSALAAGTVGWAVVRALRTRPLQLQVMVVALVAVVATAGGAVAAAEAMFISQHDLGVLGVVLIAAAAIAVGAALACTDTVADAATSLRVVARRIGDAGPTMDKSNAASSNDGHDRATEPAAVPAGELSNLAQALADTEHHLELSRRRAQALEDDRRDLVAAMSHDLRSPLATVRAMAEALEDGMVDDEETIAHYHRVISAESERLSRLVDALFELSRIASGTLHVDRVLRPIGDVVGAAVEATSVASAARSMQVEAEIVANAGEAELPGREAARIVSNLVDNAVRHSPDGGRVLVSVRPVEDGHHLEPSAEARSDVTPAGGVVVTVADTCGGIPEPDLPRVFDTAFRGDAARSRDAAGGGLGLSIAKALVELLGGRISVANVEGGCCFQFDLPSAIVPQAIDSRGGDVVEEPSILSRQA